VQPMTPGYEWVRPPQMIDEQVGIDEEVSHGPTRRDRIP
jgi:hypothetical protein